MTPLIVEGWNKGMLIALFTKWVSCCLRSAQISMLRRKILVRDALEYAPGDASQSMREGWRTVRPVAMVLAFAKKIIYLHIVSCSWHNDQKRFAGSFVN